MITNPRFVEIAAEIKSSGKQLPAKARRLQLAVCIPAKNEAESIWKTLSALANQVSDKELLSPEIYEVMVLCNHCDDNTTELCELFQKLHPDFPLYIFVTRDPVINTVGAARRVLMDMASERLPDDGLIIMTDADTVADKSWLNAFLNFQPQPVDLICGIIDPDLKGLNKDARYKLFQNRQYLDLVSRLESDLYPQQYDPWPRHSHNSGPNMAIRNSVYKQLGGIPPLACFEDIALYQNVISHGFKVKHSAAPIVTTSCRSSSRVPGGFGSQIKNWSASRIESVEGFNKLCERFKAYAEIRNYYQDPSSDVLTSISNRLHFETPAMRSLVSNHLRSSSLIIYLEHILKYHTPWNSTYPDIPINEAIEELQHYFSSFSQAKSSYRSSRTPVSSLKDME